MSGDVDTGSRIYDRLLTRRYAVKVTVNLVKRHTIQIRSGSGDLNPGLLDLDAR